MKAQPLLNVLLVEDDQDDYILTRDLLVEIKDWRFKLDWAQSFEDGLAGVLRNRHDVCLVDYRLGAQNGLDLLQAAIQGGCDAPIILLTGSGNHTVDVAAMKAGAADYLVKGSIDAGRLERSIRFAIERKRAAQQAAYEQARLAAFGAEVGITLTRRDSLEAIVAGCAESMARYLNGALAQIWIYSAEEQTLAPIAAAGTLCENGSLPDAPRVRLRIDELAEGKPVLIKNLGDDLRITDKDCVLREQLLSYAACPLLLENRLVGLMSLFSRGQLTEGTLKEMASVAHGIALCIDRKHSEQALNASEGRYRSVVESIREVVFQLTLSGQWLLLSPAWSTVTGYPVSETFKSAFLDYVHADDREMCRQMLAEARERKSDSVRREVRLLAREGDVRWMEIHLQPTLDADGAVVGFSGAMNDVTERKHAEKQIQKLAAFPHVDPNPVLEFAEDGSLTYLNNAACQWTFALGASGVQTLLPPDYVRIVRDCLATGQNHLHQQTAFNGRTLSWSFFPLIASRVVHCHGSDVTELVNLEAQFRHAQKLESVARLAAGVAHDFNNVLTVIQGYSESLLNRCRDNPLATAQIQPIHDAAARAVTLTRQLLTFSRKQVAQPKVVDLGSLVQNLSSILSRLLGEDIALETQLEQGCPAVLADAGMMEQVVMNLAINSRDAMPKGGQLRITLKDVEVDPRHARRQVGAREGRFVRLRILDTGCGMDNQTLSRIFEPFFSTKEVGKGTGLGLATVYGIVKQHQGWIEVFSKVGMGTTFDIFLPATDARPLEQASGADRQRCDDIRGARETILLVEDEADLRQLVRKILVGHNYNVVDAPDGVEALRLWEQHEGKIDLLLTDMVLPRGMDGKELATRLRTGKPELKVIFTSGYSDAIASLETNGRDGLFLPKPFRAPALAQLIRDCLHKSEPPPLALAG